MTKGVESATSTDSRLRAGMESLNRRERVARGAVKKVRARVERLKAFESVLVTVELQ
jgi:hypothetical protein